MTAFTRRDFVAQGLVAAGGLSLSRLALAAAPGQSRFVFVILRGALDGLALAPPVGDPDYASARKGIAIAASSSEGGAIPLDGRFGLHPACGFLGESWRARQLAVLHAVATPYRERSHFDGQDVLESGFERPHATQSGWLNRALGGLASSPQREMGVALGSNIPLVMRGPAAVASWAPSRLPVLDDDTLQRLGDLYASDPVLSLRLAEGLAADAIAMAARRDEEADGESPMGQAAAARQAGVAQLRETVQTAAAFLRQAEGPRVAVFDTIGWDTHANEGGAQGGLATRLRALDGALRLLHDGMGAAWDRTVVLVATEFGRTVAENGTRGTDHGTGSAALLLGGAVKGGRVVTDWPGLAPHRLHEGRDLKPTTDLRAVMKAVLHDHLEVSQRHLDEVVFPGTAGLAGPRDLLRG